MTTGTDREGLIVKIMRAADAGLISVADRDLRIDNVRRSGSDVELQAIEADIDRLLVNAAGPPGPTPPPATSRSLRRRVLRLGPILLLLVALIAIALTWAYRSMRAVMEVGGACASGGPYVAVQPCPDGAWMIGPAIPALILAALIGSAIAAMLRAPNLLLPMWGGLFGALGWNFLDTAFRGDDVVVGSLICGVMFWLMAAPALIAPLFAAVRGAKRGQSASSMRTVTWWCAYAITATLGGWFGSWSWEQLA